MNTTFEIENLKCDGCVKTAADGVSPLEGISNVTVSFENKAITFEAVNETAITSVIARLKEIVHPKKEEESFLDKAKLYFNK